MTDILSSFMKPAVEGLGSFTVVKIKHPFTYLCFFNNNIQSLRNEAQELKDARVGLQRQVEAAEKDAQVILPEVRTWLENATTKIQVDMRRIDDRIPSVKNGCWGVKSRFRLSREAVKITEEMKQLMEKRRQITNIAMAPLPAAQAEIPLGTTHGLDSRKKIEEDIMNALKAKEVTTIGICGMGGVGKTTMAKRIMDRVQKENIFQEILMVVVSQQVDLLKIQGAIAESLGLNLVEKTLLARATKLRARLTGEKRILIVFDDVWEKFKLEDLGIPFKTERCTILLTSRNKDVLKKMDAQNVYGLETLSDKEAWFLFREKIGSCVDDPNLFSTAEKVARECKGLPIPLIIVGGALKNQTNIVVWEDALQQLKSFNPDDITKDMPSVVKDVYKPLKLSYTELESRHAKTLFLLCSLFPKEEDISLEELTSYCIGLQMFSNWDFSNSSDGMLKKVRRRIFTIVDMLKNRFLLLRGRDEHHVKMHDVVRDVAIYIARHEANEGMIVDFKFNPMPLSSEYTYHWVSVHSENTSSLLRMHGRNRKFEIKDSSIFEGIQELSLLSFEFIIMKSIPLKIQLLKNLRTLRLVGCWLESISMVGNLLSLEILDCYRCDGIKELPVGIGNLCQLKQLNFSECNSLKRIPPGVVSNLVELEEFKMFGSFDGWELAAADLEGQERRNACLNEFANLPKLKCLEIEIKEISFSPNSVRYHIGIGDMKLPGDISVESWVVRFLKSVNQLYLKGDGSTVKKLVNSTTSIHGPSEYDVFPIFKELVLSELPNLEEIYDGTVLDHSIRNLQKLELVDLPALKHLWKRSNRSIVSLDELREIRIVDCKNLHSFFSFTNSIGTDQISTAARNLDELLCTQTVFFPMLEEMELWGLDKLEVIWNSSITEGSNSFKNLRRLSLCYLPSLIHLWKSPNLSVSLSCLSEIKIHKCPKLRNVLSSSIMSMDFLLRLTKFEITNCETMEQVVLNENNENQCGTIQFPKLLELKLNSLINLTAFGKGIKSIEFPMLKKMIIIDCPKLMSFFFSNLSNQNSADDYKVFYPMIEEMELSGLHKLEVIWNSSILEGSNSFKNLRSVSLSYLPALTYLWKSSNLSISLGSLSEIKIHGCHKLRNIFSSTMSMDFLLQLTKLEITNCEMIEQVVLNDNDENQFRTIRFPKLLELKLDSLKHLSAFAKGVESIEFPMLKKMIIMDCYKLKSFFFFDLSNQNSADNYKVFFPMLEEIELLGLDKLEVIWNSLILEGSNSFKNLRSVSLSYMPALMHLWKSSNLSVSFNSLSQVHIHGCHKLRNIFSSTMSMDFLLQLTDLEIISCMMMEQVVLNENNEKQCGTIQFPKLLELKLNSLINLTAFSKGVKTIEFPMLKKMIIIDCPKLMSFFFSNLSNQNSADDYKVFFPMLEEIELWGLDKLEVIWNSSIPEGSNSFKNLKSVSLSYMPTLTHLWKSSNLSVSLNSLSQVHIHGCHKLRNIFSSTMSMDFLLQLTDLEIINCEMMEQVLLNENNENQCRSIHFPKLLELKLSSLKNLTTFGKGVESIEFPMLKKMIIFNCPKLVRFFFSDLSNQNFTDNYKVFFPMLEEIELWGLDKLEVIWNSSISEGCDSFKNLRSVSLWYMPALTHLWKSSNLSVLLSSLSQIHIHGCYKLRNIFSSTMSMDFLLQLTELEITNCDMMEQVVLNENRCHTINFPKLLKLKLDSLENLTAFGKGVESIEFAMLQKMEIINCPKLMSLLFPDLSNQNSTNDHDKHASHLFCNPKISFGSLKDVLIENCNDIRSLFSSSVVENLMNLECLRIYKCKEMENVVENNEEMSLCEKSRTLFPSLKRLTLWNLPKLECFSSWIYDHFQLPSLEYVNMDECPLLKFTLKSMTAPKLKNLMIDGLKKSERFE